MLEILSNTFYCFNTGLKKPTWTGKFGKDIPVSKPILQYDKQGNYIQEFENTRQTDINYKHISACCLGKRKTAGGYIWKYKI